MTLIMKLFMRLQNKWTRMPFDWYNKMSTSSSRLLFVGEVTYLNQWLNLHTSYYWLEWKYYEQYRVLYFTYHTYAWISALIQSFIIGIKKLTAQIILIGIVTFCWSRFIFPKTLNIDFLIKEK